MSGCSTLRDHRDATGSIWLLLVVCPWLWSLCSSALIWEVPVNSGLFVLTLEPLAFSEALCLVTRSIETFKSLNVARGSWPEALPQAHLHFCSLCYHHCTWSLQGDIELYIEAWIWGLVCLQEYLKDLRFNILIIQVSLLAFPSFPTFIASGFHLKRNKKTCNFDITSYNDLSLLINNQGRNEALPSWFESCDQVSQVLILIRLTKIIVKQHPPSIIVMLPINYNENNRLEQVWHNHI